MIFFCSKLIENGSKLENQKKNTNLWEKVEKANAWNMRCGKKWWYISGKGCFHL
jgi:hypothetical protein